MMKKSKLKEDPKWEGIPENISDYFGFIYMITNKSNGKFYIGKKFFFSKRTRPPLKGRKNKRHYVVESDWKAYWGSSKELLSDIEKYGQNAFKRKIIVLCNTRWDCAYQELMKQLQYEVLFNDLSYNGIIHVRLKKQKRGLN